MPNVHILLSAMKYQVQKDNSYLPVLFLTIIPVPIHNYYQICHLLLLLRSTVEFLSYGY
jgi:hypothetical protein